jgi:HAD superfamily hydrolase (TIGR01490 family)
VAAFFDLDKTIIATSSMLAFSGPMKAEGLISRKAMLRSAYAHLLFVLGGADAEAVQRVRDQLTSLCTGWDVSQVRAIVEETLHDAVDPLVYAEAKELIARHAADGHDVVVISASGEEVVGPIARMLGATHSIGTRMVVAHGRYTGGIDFYCYGEEKAAALRELAERNGYELASCYAYTDSVTDLPMLEAVGHPCVVNPNRALRKLAAEREWSARTFSNPVSLRSRLGASSATTVAATALGVGAVAAAGATLYGLRRRTR